MSILQIMKTKTFGVSRLKVKLRKRKSDTTFLDLNVRLRACMRYLTREKPLEGFERSRNNN